MTYYHYLPKDQQLHQKYHKVFINGISWPLSYQDEKIFSITIRHAQTEEMPLKSKLNLKLNLATLVITFMGIDKKSQKQVKKLEEMLEMVNKELNAPLDSQAWKEVEGSGKAFLAVCQDKAIGVVTTDPIHSIDQCKWMIYKTQTIVPNQTNSAIKIGISRIWTAPNFRRLGIAKHLLQCVVSNSVYGVKLNKNEIGFSQPSTSGGLLAKSFNGVKHKSGEVLIPIYIEQ